MLFPGQISTASLTLSARTIYLQFPLALRPTEWRPHLRVFGTVKSLVITASFSLRRFKWGHS